jgi:hypothetical protein
MVMMSSVVSEIPNLLLNTQIRKRGFWGETGLFISMHRHTGQGSAATADPVSSATVKRRSLLPLYFKNKEQNASRFGICAGFRLGARYRSLGRNDAESLGFGRNEQLCWGREDRRTEDGGRFCLLSVRLGRAVTVGKA